MPEFLNGAHGALNNHAALFRLGENGFGIGLTAQILAGAFSRMASGSGQVMPMPLTLFAMASFEKIGHVRDRKGWGY